MNYNTYFLPATYIGRALHQMRWPSFRCLLATTLVTCAYLNSHPALINKHLSFLVVRPLCSTKKIRFEEIKPEPINLNTFVAGPPASAPRKPAVS